MKIIITNTVALNGGDAAILFSIVDLLRLEFGQDTEIIIYDSQPEIASKYYSNLLFRKLVYLKATQPPSMNFLGKSLFGSTVRNFLVIFIKIILMINPIRLYLAVWLWRNQNYFAVKFLLNSEEIQDFKNYSSADLVVSTGGTYLIEKYSLKARIFDYKMTLMLRRPLVFFTQSLGPFNKIKNQNIFRKIFNKSTLVMLRDEASYDNLKQINANLNKVLISSDVVFSFTDDVGFHKDIYKKNVSSSRVKIAISVRYWNHFTKVSQKDGFTNFVEVMSEVTQYLIEKYNAEITYISTCQGIPEYWTDDSKVAEEIINLLPNQIQKQVHLNKDFHSPKKLVGIIRNYDVVIATRMHMAILSLIAGTPVFPIAYEFKTKELFRRLGMDEWVQDIETINKEVIITSLDDFLIKLPEISSALFLKVLAERNRALESGKKVKKAWDEFNGVQL
ncbi:MAG: polysaccharide pyruvyl transferase family protein [Trichormus sp. ATA11-4-KO1]|jgi:colanic acid/amylovoran biosynthesis protein|nr:polysaccharide pyruvyl transferase family protein [Trichormus sp. ATA11-4-KO1]